MNARLIQEQVPLESQVKFSLQGGGDISGKLVEIGREHIKIEVEENQPPAVIPLERIIHWQSLKETPQNGQSEDPVPASSDTSTAEEKAKADQSKKPGTPALSSAEIETEKKLIEIEARFQAKCQSAKIALKEPDFKFPEEDLKDLGDRQRKEATTIWNRIRDKYQYAKKNNELSTTFGRIQPIITELQDLANRYRNSSSIKRHLAYFYTLSGNQEEALNNYQDTAIFSQNEIDWYNLAVVAQKSENKELACYSLGQVFQQLSITDDTEAWYLYVHLLIEFNSHRELSQIYQTEHRKFSREEISLLSETGVYLLKVADRKKTAKETLEKTIADEISISFLQKILRALDQKPTENYQSIAKEISRQMDAKEVSQAVEDQPPQGHIYSYNSHKGYGFLRDGKGASYFFHITEITDPDLREDLTRFTNEPIPVNFQAGQGSKGPNATQISRHKTIHDWYELAESAADAGDYGVAISHIKRVLLINKNYPNAKENHEKWQEYVRVRGVPTGLNPFARAKRAQLAEKDLEKAEQFFLQAITQNDNLESAVNDLASLLSQRERFEDAIKVIEQYRPRTSNQQALDNVLITIYKKSNNYDKVIELLQKQLRLAPTLKRKNFLWGQIGSSYLRLNQYVKAEELFRKVQNSQPDNISVKQNIAFCLSRQERYDEAEELLNQILAVSSDWESAKLLEAVLQAKRTGEKELLDEIVIEMELSDYSSGQLSLFTQFFLDRCDFTGVPPERVQAEKFTRSDIAYLERQATQSRTSRPSDRANYYLSAAKIISILEDGDLNRFYRFLCRCFASKGDDAVRSNENLDSAREWYAEALKVYDGDRERNSRGDEQDAVNALVRFLYSRLGSTNIPMSRTPNIDDTIAKVIDHANPRRIFNDITYLIFRSRYAANRLLSPLYNQKNLRDKALQYLKSEDIDIPNSAPSKQKFISLWDQLSDRLAGQTRELNINLRHFNNFQLTTAWLEDAIEQFKGTIDRLRFDLDQERVQHLREMLEKAVELCKQTQFEARERLGDQIKNSCRDLLSEIEKSPTRISVEMLYPVIENIQTKINEYLAELYVTSKPQLTLRLPVESYAPDTNGKIEVQIVIENEKGRSPAEALELVIKGDQAFFAVTEPDIKRDESLRGGESSILKVPLRVTHKALDSQTFSFPIYARYRTRADEQEKTQVENLSIRLYPQDDFETIKNPYAAYAEGGIVGDPAMFFGRDELIQNIAHTIQGSRLQSKCVMVFGQKRSGKSSVLYHLKTLLEKDKELLILDLGNIGTIQDPDSEVTLLYQVLKRILTELEYAIEDRSDDGFSSLDLSIPNDLDFYNHPAPLQCFQDTFKTLNRLVSRQEDWRGVRVVLLIDEFQYIYDRIVAGEIHEAFMQNWKALLQANYFSAVLVGQDVMPKFKERFPNEFGTTQDERVTYLNKQDATKLIEDPIRIGGREGKSRYREQAIERILDLTAGSPFYIQILCNRLVEYMNLKHAGLVTEADVEQVKNELIQGVNAFGLDKFDNLINSGDTSADAISDDDALKVLKAIAVNSRTGPCHRDKIDCETCLRVDKILDDLVKRDVVKHDQGQYYQIQVALFKEWLVVNG